MMTLNGGIRRTQTRGLFTRTAISLIKVVIQFLVNKPALKLLLVVIWELRVIKLDILGFEDHRGLFLDFFIEIFFSIFSFAQEVIQK